ncbi:MAG TPA: outer membrane beta-barrel protein [Kofleriaceae bacterium]|nr:outer membrane beta-barrel protein [Kofleriaceae bacterium]
MRVAIMNRLALIIILLCLPRLSEAQPELSLSLKAGPNAAAWDSELAEHKYGFSGGLAGDLWWPLRARFSLGAQMALLYVPRGTKGFDPTTGEFLATFRQHYFDTAVAFRPEARVGSVGVYLLLGGSWSILLNANAVDYRGRKDDVDLRRHDVALLAGLGGALHLPSHRLGPFRLDTVFLEARYDRGLLDFIPDDGSRKNRTASLMLGVSFALGSKAAVPLPSDPR